ncbi:MAG: universal stress protein [Anaerolineales bacterium]|nr:universal stress protein [Anaerolineales bacterium]
MLEKILVPLDGSELATCVLPYVLAMAQALGSDINLLRLLEGYDAPSGVVNPVDWQLRKIEAHSYIHAMSASLGERVTQPSGLQVVEGAAQGIIEYAQKMNSTLLR